MTNNDPFADTRKMLGEFGPIRARQSDELQAATHAAMAAARLKNEEEAKFRAVSLQATAQHVHRKLLRIIKDFDKELDQNHEVGIRLVSFGSEVTIHVDDLGYWDPNLIVFLGTMLDGSPVQLVQHTSQLSFLLTSLKRKDPSQPKKGFGFETDHLGQAGVSDDEPAGSPE
jgi:hypothetical protein